MEICPFSIADERQVVDLWVRCDLVRPWNDPQRDIRRKMAVRPDLFLVAWVGGQVVGTVMAGYEGHRGWINYLAVSPDYRRRGIGRALMARAEALLRAEGCPKINLQVRSGNSTAVAFYRRLAYALDDVISMGKRLEDDTAPSGLEEVMARPTDLICRPIGRVVKGRAPTAQDDAWEQAPAEVLVDEAWAEALEGIEGFTHLWILWWLDESAGPPEALKVRPERREEMPLLGLFATRSPRRPNPIALTAVRLLKRDGLRLVVEGLDAYEGTPVLDLKPYLRRGDFIAEATMPEWIERLWALHDEDRIRSSPGRQSPAAAGRT